MNKSFQKNIRFVSSHTLLVSSPHPKSNIRLIKYKDNTPSSFSIKEHPCERKFRKLDTDTQEWVHSFFTENNHHFQTCKEQFIQDFAKSNNKSPQSEDMSIFYSQYLDQNQKRHADFNKQWLERNSSMVIPGLKVDLLQFSRQIQSVSILPSWSSSSSSSASNFHRVAELEQDLVPKWTWKHKVNCWLRTISNGYTAQGVTVR